MCWIREASRLTLRFYLEPELTYAGPMATLVSLTPSSHLGCRLTEGREHSLCYSDFGTCLAQLWIPSGRPTVLYWGSVGLCITSIEFLFPEGLLRRREEDPRIQTLLRPQNTLVGRRSLRSMS